MLKLPLRSSASRGAFLAIVIAAALMLSLYSVRYAVTREFIDTDSLERAGWALRLDSQNALVQNRMGFLYQWQTASTSMALPYLRRATELNPHVPAYWIDLANGCELAGQ